MGIVRCIKEKDYIAIRDGKYNHQTVYVYYGFNNYRADIQHINAVAEMIRYELYAEHITVRDTDMTIHYVTREESIRHAGYTMIYVMVDTRVVNNNLASMFTIL